MSLLHSSNKCGAPALGAKGRLGFSLLEIVIVISVMAIFAGVAVPVASTMFNSKARQATNEELANLGTSVAEFFRDTEAFPSTPTDLMVDPGVAGWAGPYVLLDALSPVRGQAGGELDAWGHPYLFTASGTSTLQLSSAGIDGLQGTPDDIALDVDVTPIRREKTLAELLIINQAVLQYNAANLPLTPLPNSYSSLLNTLVVGGYLPSSTPYATDGWGQAYTPDPAGVSPVVLIASTNL